MKKPHKPYRVARKIQKHGPSIETLKVIRATLMGITTATLIYICGKEWLGW